MNNTIPVNPVSNLVRVVRSSQDIHSLQVILIALCSSGGNFARHELFKLPACSYTCFLVMYFLHAHTLFLNLLSLAREHTLDRTTGRHS